MGNYTHYSIKPNRVLLALSFILVINSYSYADYSKDSHEIFINPTVPLHKQSKEFIFSLRKEEVKKYGGLKIFPEEYIPGSSIFGQIDEKADWVHDTQFFIVNPYLLILTSAASKVNVLLPFCNVSSVHYSYRKIEEIYAGKSAQKWFYYVYDYYNNSRGIARLWFINAYDAGFKYAHIDMSKSVNIDPDWPESNNSVVKGVYSGHVFFHVGHLSKNNISPNDIRAHVRLIEKGVKTVIYVKLWRNRPADKNSKEDFAYVITMEP